MEETFTINRLGLSPRLRRCLATTNIIESSLSGVEGRTGRVTRWRDGAMALRWTAAAALETEKNFRKIIGHEDLWMLKAALDDDQPHAIDLCINNGTFRASVWPCERRTGAVAIGFGSLR